MKRRLAISSALILMAVMAIAAPRAYAQNVDARAVLQASAKAMGLDNLRSIQYAGSGWFSMIGQT